MASLTFGDKLRAMTTTPQQQMTNITQAFWNDIKSQLEPLAQMNLHDATIKIVEDSGIGLLFIQINDKALSTLSTKKLCSEYGLDFIVERSRMEAAKFINIDFAYFEKLVTADGCTYTYLNNCAFSISW